jgi:hypothetical protein
LDKAGFVDGIRETFRKRHALGGIAAIFVRRRQVPAASPNQQ